jgi:hypothetical protein
MLGHFVMGILVGTVLIPVAALGPDRAWETTESFVNQTLLPGLTTRPGALSNELTDMTATDNQSVRAIVHALVNWGTKLPREASTETKLAHAAIALFLIAATFLAVRRIPDERYRTLFLLSGLTIVSVAVTPVNHTHYMALAVPAVLGLVYWELEHRNQFRWGFVLYIVVVLHVVSGVYPRLPFLPGYQEARDLGLTMLGTLVVWAVALWLPAGRGGLLRPAHATAPSGFRLSALPVLK